MSDRACWDCEHYEELPEGRYTCQPMKDGNAFFNSDGNDTAEDCDYYKLARCPHCKKRVGRSYKNCPECKKELPSLNL